MNKEQINEKYNESEKKNGKKTIFWNVDTQYDFMRDDESFKGALAIPQARSIENNLEKITKTAEKYRIQVVNTKDWHDENTEEISEKPDYVKTFPKHCMKNTQGAEYVPATKPDSAFIVSWEFDKPYLIAAKTAKNIEIRKDKFDVFEGNPYTREVVDIINPDKVIVYGVATNYCVKYAVNGLLNHRKDDGKNIEVLVIEDAIKEIPNEPKEITINQWKIDGVKMIRTDELENYLN